MLKKITKKYNTLEFLIKRLELCKSIKKIIVATSNLKKDDKILDIKAKNVLFFRGSEQNVLERYVQTAEKFNLKHLVRITGDCPFSDPYLIDKLTKIYFKHNYDYVSNVNPPTFPNGFDIEIFSLKLAKNSLKRFKSKKNREHVTYAMRDVRMKKSLKMQKLFSLKDICGMKVIPKKLLIKQSIIQKKLLCLYLINFVLIDTNHIF